MSDLGNSISVLFICSGQYGELNMAENFTAGQDFAESASYLVPEQLRLAATGTSQRVLVYTHLDEIPLLVEEIDPDVILLFSGYLYSGGRLFSLQPWPLELIELKKLITALRNPRRALATSDPFCGLAGRLKPWSFRLSRNGLLVDTWWKRLIAPVRSVSIWLHFKRLHTLLKALPHIYPGRVPVSKAASLTLAFFNQAAVHRANTWLKPALDEKSTHAPTWLFVISPSDLMIHRNMLGRDFAIVVANRLTDAHDHGRTPILIAPRSFLDEIRSVLEPNVVAVLNESLPYSEFSETLINCEYAFYWNIFSHSTLLRIFLGRPVFFFDRGHLPRLIFKYHEEAVRCYLGGAEPQILNPTRNLSADYLASLNENFRNFSSSVLQHLSNSPSPSHVVEELIAGSKPIG